jgi:hypothetical protein
MSKTMTLKQMIDGYRPKPGDEQKFREKHLVAVNKSLGGKATEDDNVFNASNVKTVDRQKERHGYNSDKGDEKVYEQKMTNKVCEDCGCSFGNPEPGCDCKHDCNDAKGSNWVSAVKEGVEDRIAAAREKAALRGKIKDPEDKPEEKKPPKRFVQGKSYGGAKQKPDSEDMKEDVKKVEDKEEVNESKTSDALYKQHCDRVKNILKQLGTAVDTHKKNVMQGTSHYGHVSDMNSFANQLQDLHDRMSMQGDYAKPIQLAAVKESVEQVDEKKLTSAEMKKREEIAKAIERKNPEMPMAKKMAIATATAKKVAEQKTFTEFMNEAKSMSVTLHVAPHPSKPGHHVVTKSSDPSRFKKGETVSKHELEQGQDDGYLKVKHQKKQGVAESSGSVAEGVLSKIKKAASVWAKAAVVKTANQQLGPAGGAAVQHLITPEKK